MKALSLSFIPDSLKYLAVLLLALLAGQPQAHAQSQEDVTVAFIYNFARFVEWPPSTFAAANAPFTIGFVGRPALAQRFTQAVQGKTVAGRELAVRKLDDANGASDCQIVFVGEGGPADAVVHATKGKPVLCIGEGEGFLALGGMIAFSREGARLVFDVNPGVISAASLKPGEKLTKAARSVKGG